MSNQSSGNQTWREQSSGSTVRLLAVATELSDFLTPEEREHASHIVLPTQRLSGAVDIAALLAKANAFAALVVDGLLVRQTQIGEQPTMRIFGPGELLATGTAPTSMLMVQSECRAVEVSRVAFIGLEFLAGAHRWPRLVAGLQARMADGTERLATQLAISQLPRVQDRILAMLWLLAESWGHVTASGTTLSLALTHETLGALVGARRPTVTLALRELTERGALVHQDRSWLLLEPPFGPLASSAELDAPEVLQQVASPWLQEEGERPSDPRTYDMLLETVDRLREDHRRNAEQHRTMIRELTLAREHNARIRLRIRSDRPPGTPS